MGEFDEFDINVVIKLPFDKSEVTLNYNDSSPSYALVEIPENIVKSYEENYDMFSEKDGAYHISAQKLDQYLNLAINLDLNMLNNNGGGGGHGLSKSHLDFNPDLFTNIMIMKTPEGWTTGYSKNSSHNSNPDLLTGLLEVLKYWYGRFK